MNLVHVRIVLVRPQEPRNVGAVCRVMKNFGLRDLVIVDPQGPADVDLRGDGEPGAERGETARRLAVHATDILDGARVVRTVEAAVADAGLVVGTTMRLGQKRKRAAVLPEALATRLTDVTPVPTALLFGNERLGLSDDELAWASEVVAIPADPGCPSLNLSHAVAVVCYSLYRSALAGAVEEATGLPLRTPVSVSALHELTGGIEQSLGAMGFQTQEGPQGMRAFLNDILGRAGLSDEEAARVGKLFASLAGLHRGSTQHER